MSPEAGTPTSCTTVSLCPRSVPQEAAWTVQGLGPPVVLEEALHGTRPTERALRGWALT